MSRNRAPSRSVSSKLRAHTRNLKWRAYSISAPRWGLYRSHLRADRPLNHHGVGPFAEPKGHCAQITDLTKAAGLVQPKRGDVGAVDIPDHLVKAGRGACLDQRRQKSASDADVETVRVDVDRMLGRESVGRALAEQHGVGVAGH